VIYIFAIFGEGWKAASRTNGGGKCGGGQQAGKSTYDFGYGQCWMAWMLVRDKGVKELDIVCIYRCGCFFSIATHGHLPSEKKTFNTCLFPHTYLFMGKQNFLYRSFFG